MYGRETLGDSMPVILYRFMQTSILQTLEGEYGKETSRAILKRAGYIAGGKLVDTFLNLNLPLNEFISHLQEQLVNHKIGYLSIDDYDAITKTIRLTIREDLDCSGEPCSFETLCVYDEGLLEAILNQYTGESYKIVETECWGTGQPHCRFEGTIRYE